MLYLATPSTQTIVDAMAAGLIGMIDTPYQGGKWVRAAHAVDVEWCADNGAFTDRWDEGKWWRWLNAPQQLERLERCLFATAPDVVGDWRATEARSRPWLERIRGLGYPVAYVAQNGMEHSTWDLWDEIDVLFIGGTWECRYHGARPNARTNDARGMHLKAWCEVAGCGLRVHEWKLSDAAVNLAHVAGSVGKWVHVGRVNSAKRIQWAAEFAHSADGTILVRGPDKNLPRVLAFATQGPRHESLF